MTEGAFAAVDLGASSGRVMVGRVGPRTLDLREVHRFPNEPFTSSDGLHWDIDRLYRETREGLRLAGREAELLGIGVDSWGCDYGLLDEGGDLIGPPYHYREARTEAAVAQVEAIVPADRLYARTGMQFLPFNTIYQLVADRAAARLDRARTVAMIPDLVGYWLTGVIETEETNASTTGLVDPVARTWAPGLAEEIGLSARILGPIRQPGDPLGNLHDAVAAETRLPQAVTVRHVGSHDTASAVVGVPAADERFAYIACGTWGLVGVELEQPIMTEASRQARFTNELGVDGRVRYLHNVMGLWLLQESMRTWERAGDPASLPDLLAAATELPAGGPTIDPNDEALLAPGDMPGRIAEQLARTNQPTAESRPALVRCILDSLAAAFASTVRDAAALSGRSIAVVHLVGGGSQNALLCQLTADACALPVVAGPVEATALGNVLVQARSGGLVSGDLETLRALVRATSEPRRYDPRPVGASRRR